MKATSRGQAVLGIARGAALLAALLTLHCGGKSDSGHDAGASGAAANSGRSAITGGRAATAGGSKAAGGEATGGSVALGGRAGNGGSPSEGGVAPGQGGAPIISFGGRAGGTSAGGAPEAGAGGDTCDQALLWQAILQGALGGLGTCAPADIPGSGETTSRRRGAVVFDTAGKLIDNTGLSGTEKQTWLDMLANDRWLCFAEQSLGYQCRAAP